MKKSEEKYHKWYQEVDYEEFQRSGNIVHKEGIVSDECIAKGMIGGAPNTGFQIVRTEMLIRAFSLFGGKGRVLAYLIQEKDKENLLRTSIKEISDFTKASIQTVTDALKLFWNNGLISVQTSGSFRYIFVNPGIGHFGNRIREKSLMNNMEAFDKNAKKQKESEEESND